MITEEQVPSIINDIRRRLEQAAQHNNVHLSVRIEESKLDDEWLYVCVEPLRPGERASEHADLMAQIEKELREEGIENVILVPVIPD